MASSYFQLEPRGQCSGSIQVPGDKSISHRAVILASLAEGTSEITGFLPATDCEATLTAFHSMGVKVVHLAPTQIRIQGVGLKGLHPPHGELNMGNSGTAMRLMAGILCGQNFPSTLIGDESLCARPMQRIQVPLQQMGAEIVMSNEGTPPLEIQPSNSLHGIRYQLPMASAQVKSCILLAGLYAQDTTCIDESILTRDHTERMLQTFSYPIEIADKCVCVTGGNRLKATNINIPGDISSAAFFIVGTLISDSAELVIENVGINPTRDGVVEILRLMGANIEIKNIKAYGAEPVADLVIRSSNLYGIDIPQHLIAKSIDEFPILFIAAACAQGTTNLSGAQELRLKESDRIHNMVVGLQILGIEAEEKSDGLTIMGGKIKGGEINSGGDHRVAMAFTIASLVSTEVITVRNTDNVATSFPDFVTCASKLGLKFRYFQSYA